MGGALGIPFAPCQSRKRQSWEHGHALAIPFSSACRGNGYHGIMACACDSLFPLPVEEKAIVGCLGNHGNTACARGSAGLRGALQGSTAWNCLSFDRQGEMAITGPLV